MSTATPPPVTDQPVPGPSAWGSSAAIRFLTVFGATLLPLGAAVVAMVAFEVAWSLSAAGAVVTGWSLGTAGWLHSRSWAAGAVLAVLAAPAAVLAGAGAAGWLTPAGSSCGDRWAPCSPQRRRWPPTPDGECPAHAA